VTKREQPKKNEPSETVSVAAIRAIVDRIERQHPNEDPEHFRALHEALDAIEWEPDLDALKDGIVKVADWHERNGQPETAAELRRLVEDWQ
jgi:hypothetical protein